MKWVAGGTSSSLTSPIRSKSLYSVWESLGPWQEVEAGGGRTGAGVGGSHFCEMQTPSWVAQRDVLSGEPQVQQSGWRGSTGSQVKDGAIWGLVGRSRMEAHAH